VWGLTKDEFYLGLAKLRNELAQDRNDVLKALALMSKIIPEYRRDTWATFRQLRNIEKRLVALEARLSGAAVEFKITQQGDSMGAIVGTPLGGTSNFSVQPLQADGKTAGTLQAGNIPQWSSTDANVQITQSADGLSASVTLAAAEANSTYPLTVSGVNSDGNAITSTFSIPVLAAVPPPPPDQAATQFGLSQNS
jgi:hypothetical protein